MFNFFLLFNVLFILNGFSVSGNPSNKRLCANKDCTKIVGYGKTILGYSSPSKDKRILSYKSGENVTIYSKEAGTNQNLWGVEINGTRGYAPKNTIKETIAKVKPEFVIDTENIVPSNHDSDSQPVKPEPTQSYVVDGTTIYDSSMSAQAPTQENFVNTNQETQPLNLEHVQKNLQEGAAPTPIKSEVISEISNTGTLEQLEVSVETPLDTLKNSEPLSQDSLMQGEQLETNPTLDPTEVNRDPIKQDVSKTEANEITPQVSDTKNNEEKPQSSIQMDSLKHEEELKINSINSAQTSVPTETSNAKITQEIVSDINVSNMESSEITPQITGNTKDNENKAESPIQMDSFKQEDGLKMNLVNPAQTSVPTETTKDQIQQEVVSDINVSNTESSEKTSQVTDNTNDNEGKSESPIQKDELKLSAREAKENLPKDSVVNNIYSSVVNLMSGGGDEDTVEEDDSYEEDEDEDEDGIVEEEVDGDDGKLQGELAADKGHEANLEVPPIKDEQTIPETSNLQTESLQSKQMNEAEGTGLQESLSKMETHSQPLQQSMDQEQLKEVFNQTYEPEQVEVPDTHAGSNVVSDDQALENSQNETTAEKTPTENDIQKDKLDDIKRNEFVEDGQYLFNKQNIDAPLPEVNEEKLPFVEGGELFSRKEPHSHVDQHSYNNLKVPNESENQNEKDEISNTLSGMNQNILDHSNFDNDQQTLNEAINEKTEKENVQSETPTTEKIESHRHDLNSFISQHIDDQLSCSADPLSDCNINPQDFRAAYDTNNIYKIPNSAILTVLVIAAVTVVTFLWGYMYMEKRGRESNLVGKINNIQKEYLIVKKQNEMLKDKLEDVEVQFNEKANKVSNEMLLNVQEQLEREQNTCSALELQVHNLEKELENSTEVGLELNRMLSEFLNSENGSESLVANIEQLQRQIIEQQGIINTYNENLSMKETENHELRLEVDINNTKVTELQSELNKMALSLLKLEEDKEQLQSGYEGDVEKIKEELEFKKGAFAKEKNKLKEQLQEVKDKYEQVQKDLELKCNEYLILKEGISQIKKIENNGDALRSLLDVSTIQAELLQLRKEKQLLMEQLQEERNKIGGYEVKCQSALKDLQSFKERYDEADREKVEALTKLQVLDKYFKEREAHLQKELSKQESMWVEKQGEATSTIERIKYMQEELQNYKIQNESLKQEILEQEVQMKSQISVLEKKAHENWVSARQAERKLEDAKQEAAQLRNRLTLRERSFTEDKMHNRVQSPLEQNGELPVSPSHISNDTAASPPLLFGTRENLTISPPLPALPFLPPPPGVPFMPPPLGGVPLPPPGFMPPPPSLMPGDHRPPPLGRISSPPLNSRYSPDRGYSPYSRNSPSPTSDDDYDRMPQPPMYRGYNSYSRDDRREIHRPPPVRGNLRNNKGGGHSSASTNSNDSLDKINRHNSKIGPFFDYHYEF